MPRRLVVRRPSAVDAPVRRAALDEPVPPRPENLCSKHRHVQSQADMEKEFHEYFGGLVREWNPCFDEDGRARFVWDESVEAHDVEVFGVLAQRLERLMMLRSRENWNCAESAAEKTAFLPPEHG